MYLKGICDSCKLFRNHFEDLKEMTDLSQLRHYPISLTAGATVFLMNSSGWGHHSKLSSKPKVAFSNLQE